MIAIEFLTQFARFPTRIRRRNKIAVVCPINTVRLLIYTCGRRTGSCAAVTSYRTTCPKWSPVNIAVVACAVSETCIVLTQIRTEVCAIRRRFCRGRSTITVRAIISDTSRRTSALECTCTD